MTADAPRWRAVALAIAMATTVACGDRSGSADKAPRGSDEAAIRAGENRPASTAFPRTIRDGIDQPVTLPAAPRRIVSQTLGTDEILFAICPPNRIVGVSTLARDPAYSHVVAEATALKAPAIDTVETVITLKPDLVFVASYSRAELVDLLRQSGAPVFRFSHFDRIDDIANNIRTIGYAIGEDAPAERVIADMHTRVAKVRARGAASGRRPRIMSYDSLGYTASNGTLFDDVIKTVGGVNVPAEQGLKGTNGFVRISSEQVLAMQPEYLVVGAKPGEEDVVRRRMLADPAIAASTAVKSGHLILMSTRELLTTSHHVVRVAELLADALYGPEPSR
jgi:cobalamin transport system substrate-binding protein